VAYLLFDYGVDGGEEMSLVKSNPSESTVSIAHMVYVHALKDADDVLARFLGPEHPARVALRPLSTREFIQQKLKDGEL